MHKCKHFAIHELVPPELLSQYGRKSWKYLDKGMLIDLDTLRDHVFERTGQYLVINNWKWGGQYSESGLRVPSSTCYNPFSAHTFGKAFDVKLSGWFKGDFTYDLDWLQNLIRELKSKGLLPAITEMELGTIGKKIPWCHIGGRNIGENELGLVEFYG